MSQQTTHSEPAPILGPDDPPPDFSREEAAYQKERARLVRDFLGWIVLVHQDEVVGAFRTAGEAMMEGFRRFGDVKVMICEITASDKPAYMPNVDINHPSFQRLD